MPATWCDAHHLTHWARGGPSSLRNAALLCPRHHTRVHDHDLTATVTATGVTWHT
ncbi:MAG: HNH endonuclease [Terracoccus sp.]